MTTPNTRKHGTTSLMKDIETPPEKHTGNTPL